MISSALCSRPTHRDGRKLGLTGRDRSRAPTCRSATSFFALMRPAKLPFAASDRSVHCIRSGFGTKHG